MMKKILCICFCTLLIATTLPTVGMLSDEKESNVTTLPTGTLIKSDKGVCTRDALIIDPINKLVYFGLYRSSFMTPYEDYPIYWNLFKRTTEWAVDHSNPSETKIAFFSYDGKCCDDPDVYRADACTVKTFLLNNGYILDEYHQKDVSNGDYSNYDLVIYWNLYGYDCQNILNQQIPFITDTIDHVDTMNIGTNSDIQARDDEFNVVNNDYYPTEHFELGLLNLERDIWYFSTEATGNGIGLLSIGFRPSKPITPNGPTYGNPGIIKEFITTSIDPTYPNAIKYKWDWGDGTTSEWIGPFGSGNDAIANHTWNDLGSYGIKVKAKKYNCESSWSDTLTILIAPGPSTPTITGPTNGKTGKNNDYSFVGASPDGTDICYYIDWGDGESETTTHVSSGTEVTVGHTWVENGDYIIKAKTMDTKGGESQWATLPVKMSRNRAIQRPFFNFLQNHLILYQLLTRLLNL